MKRSRRRYTRVSTLLVPSETSGTRSTRSDDQQVRLRKNAAACFGCRKTAVSLHARDQQALHAFLDEKERLHVQGMLPLQTDFASAVTAVVRSAKQYASWPLQIASCCCDLRGFTRTGRDRKFARIPPAVAHCARCPAGFLRDLRASVRMHAQLVLQSSRLLGASLGLGKVGRSSQPPYGLRPHLLDRVEGPRHAPTQQRIQQGTGHT